MFGVRNHADVRKALRFFSERRVKVHFVDFKIRPPAIGELRRFVDRFGVSALIDRNARRFGELGLATARYGDAKLVELLSEEPLLLVLPLVRCGAQLAVGHDETAWARWVTEGK